jgi:PPK2 family polyphosphate:nucleotide phosphotransferase
MNYAHRIDGKKRVHLKEYDPEERRGLTKEEAQEKTEELSRELNELDDLLFAAGQQSMLIILQGRDTSGKDGAIRHLLNIVNVQSCRVVPFKVPTPIELAHDFLWRIHAETPPRGAMHIFNRSHYEDVLVVRVHNLVPEAVWRKRYDHINAFERLLVDSGTILLKFYLHISKEEQEKRLLEREKETEKAWKLSVGDWKERELWDRYTEAYEEALTRCSSPEIPWHIVPANNKWFRDLAITEQVVEALRPYRKPWMEHLSKIGETAKRELMEYRAQRTGA